MTEYNGVFGHAYLVKVEYNTDYDGREIDPLKEDYPVTLHGPFDTVEDATEWMDGWPDGDTELHEISVITMNRVAP